MLLESSGGRDGIKLVQPKSVVLRMAAGIGVLPFGFGFGIWMSHRGGRQSLSRRPLYVARGPKGMYAMYLVLLGR